MTDFKRKAQLFNLLNKDSKTRFSLPYKKSLSNIMSPGYRKIIQNLNPNKTHGQDMIRIHSRHLSAQS